MNIFQQFESRIVGGVCGVAREDKDDRNEFNAYFHLVLSAPDQVITWLMTVIVKHSIYYNYSASLWTVPGFLILTLACDLPGLAG